MRRWIVFLLVCFAATAAGPQAERRLIELAQRSRGLELRDALLGEFGREKLEAGAAFAGYRGDFFFAVLSAAQPKLFVDDRPAPGRARRVKRSEIWIHTTKLSVGRSHAYYFEVDGERIGKTIDVRAYAPDHYPRADTPQGRVSKKFGHTSKIYPGMKSDWWFYASPGVDPERPAPLMVWQDGQRFAMRDSPSRLFTVTENLVRQGRIPPMIQLMIAPGYTGEKRMRSIEYDTVTDRYARFVLEEILPELEKHYKVRADAYSRGIAGQSSGGICALNAAWQRPDAFARVLSRIGSYTAIAWRSRREKGGDVLDGGHFFPSMVRKAKKRNIRVWMEDGAQDLENSHGSWPLQNIQLANSLKMRGYDFRFNFGNARHSTANGDSLLPEALAWLWRDYDPARTGQSFEMDPAEKAKPYFRVVRLNRHE